MEQAELKIENSKEIYSEIVKSLVLHHDKPAYSIEFIVEGTKDKPLVAIRYPGRKLKRRKLKRPNSKSALWANLFDFVVIPYFNGKAIKEGEFTFEKILRDFQDNKKSSKLFWELIEEMYYSNRISKEPPNLDGINSKIYLLVLKWIWIQEDFNYKLKWDEVDSPIKYTLETRTGSSTAGGAGRAKFFAALILLKHDFTFEVVKKIIPLY